MKKTINSAGFWLLMLALPIVLGGFFSNQAKGQNTGSLKPTQEEKDAKKDEIQAKKDEKEEVKCEKIKEKINSQLTQFENNQQNRKKAYEQIQNKLNNLVINLKKQGLDTTGLENTLADFKNQLQNFYTEHEELMTQLRATQNYACEESDGQFKGELKKTREQLRIAHRERLELRKQFVEEIRPALLELRNQIQTQNTDESSTEDNNPVEIES